VSHAWNVKAVVHVVGRGVFDSVVRPRGVVHNKGQRAQLWLQALGDRESGVVRGHDGAVWLELQLMIPADESADEANQLLSLV